jgi:hypothetical protein
MDVMALRMKYPAQCHVRCTCLTSARLTSSRLRPSYCDSARRGKYAPLVRNSGSFGGRGSASDVKFRVRRGKSPCSYESLYLLRAKAAVRDTVSILIGRGVMSHEPLARNSLLCSRIHCRHFYQREPTQFRTLKKMSRNLIGQVSGLRLDYIVKGSSAYFSPRLAGQCIVLDVGLLLLGDR